jgi:hypothetical protein
VVPTDPVWWELHTFEWRGVIYADTRLPFGSRGSVAAFQRVSDCFRRYISVRCALSNYLDDFMVMALRRELCRQGYDLVVSTLRRLGWSINVAKCQGPCQRLVFLGVGIGTMCDGEGRISVFLDEGRLQRLRLECLAIAQIPGGWVRFKRLESLLGHLSFCAVVLGDCRHMLYELFGALAAGRRRGLRSIFVGADVKKDLQAWANMHKEQRYERFIDRRVVSTALATWDASLHGAGIFHNGVGVSFVFADEKRGGTALSKESLFPDVGPDGRAQNTTIAYLELWAGFMWIRHFAKPLRGCTVVVHSDNTNVVAMLRRRCGVGPFRPLLAEIRRMLLRYDVELDVHWIATKANGLADALSRADWRRYEAELQTYKSLPWLSDDDQDWMLRRDLVMALDADYGPFSVDGAVDIYRANAHFSASWSAMEDCRRMSFHAKRVYINPPFSGLLIEEVLEHFLTCKYECPVGTAAMFILPEWRQRPFWDILARHPHVFRVVRRWGAGSDLFTSPVPAHRGTGREYRGATQWPVIAVWARPEPPSAPVGQ